MLSGIIGFQSDKRIELKENLDRMINILASRGLRVERYFDSPYALVKIHSGAFDEGVQPHMFKVGNEAFLLFFDGKIISVKEMKDEDLGVRRDVEIFEQMLKSLPLERLLLKLNGTFAGILINLSRRKVYLFNDKYGTRYMFYGWWKNRLVFSSEIRAWKELSGFDKKINWSAALEFLRFGYVLGEHTIVSGIKKMRNGVIIEYEIDSNHFHTTQYWDYTYNEDGAHLDKQYLIDEFNSRMEKAVARCYMRTKGTMGTNLSGGLDTRLILSAITDSARSRTVACNYGDQGSLESKFSAKVAKTKGVKWAYAPHDYHQIRTLIEETVKAGGLGVSGCRLAYLTFASKIFRTKHNVGMFFTGVAGTWLFGGKAFGSIARFDADFEMHWKKTSGVAEFFQKWRSRNGLSYSEIIELFKPVANEIEAVKGEALKFLKEKCKRHPAKHPFNKIDYLMLTPTAPGIWGTGAITRHWMEDFPIMFDDSLIELYLEIPPELRRADFRLMALRNKGGPLAKIGWLAAIVPLNSPMALLIFMKGFKQLINKTIIFLRNFSHGRVNLRKFILLDHIDHDSFFREHLRNEVAAILLSKRTLSRGIYNQSHLKKMVTDFLNYKSGSASKISILMSFEISLRDFFDYNIDETVQSD